MHKSYLNQVTTAMPDDRLASPPVGRANVTVPKAAPADPSGTEMQGNGAQSPTMPPTSAVAPFNGSTSPLPERRESIARPILPPTQASGSSLESEEGQNPSGPISRSAAEPPGRSCDSSESPTASHPSRRLTRAISPTTPLTQCPHSLNKISLLHYDRASFCR